jgi:hypothetical protein
MFVGLCGLAVMSLAAMDVVRIRHAETLAIDEDCARDTDREIRYLLGME